MKQFIAFLCICSTLLATANSVDALENENSKAITGTKAMETNSSNTSDYLVVPIPFSNPTLGTGINAVGLYLHAKRDKESLTPTTAVVALYSSNKSWMGGVFHEDFWDHGKNRMKAGIGVSELHLNYYGIGEDEESVYKYRMNVMPIVARYQRQVFDDNLFFGVQYIGLFGQIQGEKEDSLLPSEGKFKASALGLVTTYDSRDDIYFPTSGMYSELIYNHYAKIIGSDFNAELLKAYSTLYIPHLEGSTFASKIEYKYNSSREPFFLLPSVSLRGFDKTKYIDQTVLQVQNEERFKFSSNFTTVAFLEAGVYGATIKELSINSLIVSYGAGLRYKVLEKKKINLAVDVAFSEADSAIYLRLGEAF